MAQVIADPKEMERFRGHLKNFNSDLDRMTNRLNGQLRELGKSWKDREYQKFSEEMDRSIREFKRYLESADNQLRDLRNKAYHLNKYGGA